jgi:type VI secretion system secreted protein VgrG
VRSGYTQATAFLKIKSPFGANDLLLDAMDGSEGISEPFKFLLHMRSQSTSLAAATIIGQPVTITMAVTGGPTRYFNGIVNRFVQTGQNVDFALYQAEVVPKLWLLTLSRNRKIYQAKSVTDIVKAVLGAAGVTFSAKTTGTYAALDYCVQYDETDFDFISRLMEGAGIFYFFTFANGTHTMVLADATSAHVACTGADKIRFVPQVDDMSPIDTVSRFEHEHRLVLKTATLSDHDYLNPSTSLLATSAGTLGSGTDFEYPAGHLTASAGTNLAKIRVQANQVAAQTLRGDSFAYAFSAGTKFTLSGHFVTALNTSFVLRRIHHTARDNLYSNSFEAFPATVPFRSQRSTPRPRAIGSETALVVGSKGEEIWTDKYGRIKVQFYWDRDGKKTDTSSTWIRVAQPVAGKGFGALFLPRVGQEVVVSYLNGDPDRPIVTGAVYNGENSPPVTLPASQTQSSFKTRSSKSGTAGNELRFEDKKGSDQFYMHAQKDMVIAIENALTTTITTADETVTLTKGNRTVALKKGNDSLTVAGTRTKKVTGNETVTNSAKYTHTVTGDYALKVNGKLTISASGGITFSSSGAVSMSAGTSLTNKAGTTLVNQAGTNLTNKAGVNMTNQASVQMNNKGAMITSKASAMHTVEAGALLTLKGALAKIN